MSVRSAIEECRHYFDCAIQPVAIDCTHIVDSGYASELIASCAMSQELAVTPVIGGAAVKGPTAKIMGEIGIISVLRRVLRDIMVISSMDL